jgi:hypothetical protein
VQHGIAVFARLFQMIGGGIAGDQHRRYRHADRLLDVMDGLDTGLAAGQAIVGDDEIGCPV